MGCNDSVNKNISVEMINFNGMTGKSEYLHFINQKEGYSFNYITESKEQTEEQLNNSNFFPESTDVASIYKTTDGGKNWVSIYSINNYHFYNTAIGNDKNIFIKIIDCKENLKNKLLRINLSNNKVTILNFNFERMGEIWLVNEKVFINSENNSVSNIYTTDTNFIKIDSTRENKVFQDKITLLGKIPYVLTWENEVYNIENKTAIKFNDIELEVITKKNKQNLLVAGKKNSSIILFGYNVNNKQKDYLKEFEGYNIVQGLQSNDKVICGFIGNIKGAFTEYDLFYSLDKGKTWKIQELKEKNYIRPSVLVDGILYVLSGGKRIQKISFK